LGWGIQIITRYTILVGKPGGDHLEDLGVDGNIILEWILNMVGVCRLESSGQGEGAVEGSCEHGNEPSGSIKYREYG
jgi:hypothetical protein